MFLSIGELVLALFLVWVVANVCRALFFKSQLGGGFWGLYNFMTSTDRKKQAEKEIEEEVQRRVASRMAEAAGKKGDKQ